MIKVFHIIGRLNLGGAQRVAINIASSRNPDVEYHIVEVINSSGAFNKALQKECSDKNITIHHSLFSNPKLAIILFPLCFIYLVVRKRPNIIHVHTEVPDLSIYLWFRLFGFLFKNIKYVRTIHNVELWNKWKNIGAKIEPFYINNRCNVAISKSTQECYKKAYGEKPYIINNGVDIPVQQPFDGIVRGKLNILFAGRLEYQKGIDELVQVVTALKDDDRFIFHIVGSGSLKEKIDVFKEYTHVRLYDKIFNLASYLSSFDYLFMPSNFEGLALLSIEASFAKLPTINNSCPGLKDTLPDDWPLSVQDNNVADFINIFRNIETYKSNELGEKAYAYAVEHFSLEKMQKEYEQVYMAKCRRC